MQKMMWCEQQGGPKVPREVADRRVPPVVLYMDNRFVVERGQECLGCNKLRDGAATTNCVANCCHTLLLAEHPVYQGNSVLMFPQVAMWKGLGGKDPQIYFWVKDWKEADYLALEPKLPGIFVDHSAPKEQQPAFVTTVAGSWEAGACAAGLGMGAFVAAHSAPPPAGPGIQFADIPAAKRPTILGLSEGDESHGKKSAAGAA